MFSLLQKKEEDEYYEWLKGRRKEDIADAEQLVSFAAFS